MYEHFYGLRERPFDLTPNPRFLFLAPVHRRALINLDLGISARKGVVALIGEPGTGKTTVARALMARRKAPTTYVYLNQSVASAADLRRCLVQSFELGPRAEASSVDLVRELTRQLAVLRDRGRAVALIVDEAQSLSDELLEEVRLLSNIETAESKLLTLILIGQPKLATRLNEESWKQLKQRIEIRSVLTPLELAETTAYVWSRVQTAGGDAARLFTADAIRLIHERSRGIARSISVIGENALVTGFAENERPVTRRVVLQVCEELDLPDHTRPAPAATPAGIPRSAAWPAANGHDAGPPPLRERPVVPAAPSLSARTGRRWWYWPRTRVRT